MYHAKSEVKDGHALRLAILIIVLTAAGFSLWLHTGTAIKYWLLKNYGATAKATVISLKRADSVEDVLHRAEPAIVNQRNAIKDLGTWVSGDDVTVSFRDAQGDEHKVDFLLPQSLSGNIVPKVVTIAYLPQRPGIAFPLRHLEELNFDARVTIWSCIIGIVALIWLRSAVRRWRRFRSKMRYY